MIEDQFSLFLPRYIILRGSCSVFIKDSKGISNHVATLKPGSSFGEVAFVDVCSKRVATVVSSDETVLLIVDQSSKFFVSGIRSTIVFDRQKKYSFLKSIEHRNMVLPHLGSFGHENQKQADRDFRELAKFAFSKCFHSGDVVVEQGSVCSSIFFVVNGSFDIIVSLKGTLTLHPNQLSNSAQAIASDSTIEIENNRLTAPSFFHKVLKAEVSKFTHSNAFHAKLISEVMSNSNHKFETLDGDNYQHSSSSLKIDDSSTDALQVGLVPHVAIGSQESSKFAFGYCKSQSDQFPRPPGFKFQDFRSPRAGKYVQHIHDSRSRRKLQKTFHLKTAVGGNVIGLPIQSFFVICTRNSNCL
jgi:hypothetical protein